MKDKYQMSLENNILFAKRNIVDNIYSEAKIEGVAVTYPQTQQIYDGITVAGMKVEDVIKVNNLKHAWHFILDSIDYPMDLRYLRQLNKEIGTGLVIEPGNLRSDGVSIGGTTWKPEIPDYDECEVIVRRICSSDESVTEKALDLMLFVMRSQMFHDGNKRTAQIAANQMMIQGGCGIIKIPTDQMEVFFTELIDYYETDDGGSLKQFLYDKCIEGLSGRIINQPEVNEDMFTSKKQPDRCTALEQAKKELSERDRNER